MEMNRFMTFIVCMVIGTILIMSVLVPVINDSGSDSGSGSGTGTATDVLYYNAPVDNEEHVYSIVNDFNDDEMSSGTLKILLDDSVMKEITWDDTSVDQNNKPDDIAIPILFGGFTTDMQGVSVSISYMYYVGVTYMWMDRWVPMTNMIEAGVAIVGTDSNIIYNENDISDTPHTISVIGDTISNIDEEVPLILYSSIKLMLNNDGTHFYIKNPEFNSDDDITVVGYSNETRWIDQTDWDMWGAGCWFTGKIAYIDEMNYHETSNSTAVLNSSTAVANMTGDELESIDMTVTFEDNHEMEMQIDHAIVPVYEIDDGGSGDGGSDSGPVKAILTVIPLLMIVGMVLLGLNMIFKKE